MASRQSRMFQFGLVAMVIIGVALCPRVALSAGWHYYDPHGPVALGDKTMKFVAMQPKRNIDRVCDALPDTGPTVIALDFPDPELRDMNWDIRVLRDLERGDGGEADGEIVFRAPVQKFRNGMANFDHTFVGAGKYVLVAKITSDDGAKEYLGRHRFTVGLLDNTELYAYVLFGCFLVAAGGGAALVATRKRKTTAEG